MAKAESWLQVPEHNPELRAKIHNAGLRAGKASPSQTLSSCQSPSQREIFTDVVIWVPVAEMEAFGMKYLRNRIPSLKVLLLYKKAFLLLAKRTIATTMHSGFLSC
jgi:hypothetical protein